MQHISYNNFLTILSAFLLLHPHKSARSWKIKDLTELVEQEGEDFDINTDPHVIETCKHYIPEISLNLHKGQLGRVGVFGGSLEYTGAPFFGAMAALRTGADMAYIFCAKQASTAIKAYSPELMVLPCLEMDNAIERMKPWLVKLNAILIGPGLGRHDEKVTDNVIRVIDFYREKWEESLPLIIDADGIYLILDNLNLLADYPGPVFLTPNMVEFAEIAHRILEVDRKTVTPEKHLRELSKRFGPKVLILLKGKQDLIAQDYLIVKSMVEGSARRSGGQGDLLAGCLATFSAWLDKSEYYDCGNYTPEVIVAFSASAVVKLANKLAYQEKGRGLIASDMLKKIHTAYDILFGNNSLSHRKKN